MKNMSGKVSKKIMIIFQEDTSFMSFLKNIDNRNKNIKNVKNGKNITTPMRSHNSTSIAPI